MTYAKTLQDQLAEFDETYQDRLQLDTDGTADGFIEVGDDIKNLLTSFAEKIAQSVREEEGGKLLKIFDEFNDEIEFEEMAQMVRRFYLELTTLATLDK